MKITKQFLPLVKGIDLSLRRLPILKIESGQPGPTVWIAAAIHGDEVTGTAIVQSLLSKLKRQELLIGRVFCLPVMNPSGFEIVSRSEQYEMEDLNRYFGGDAKGSPAERHAAVISEAILGSQPDLVIDLHCDSLNSIAYTIVDAVSLTSLKTTFLKSCRLAEELAFPWAVDLPTKVDYPLTRTLSGYMVSRGIAAVTIELGPPLVVVNRFRRQGLSAIWQMLVSRGMVAKQPVSFNKGLPLYVFHEKLRAQTTGIIEYRAKAGSVLLKGQILGKVRNVFGRTIEVVRSPVAGILFSHADQSIVFPGQELFVLARTASLELIRKDLIKSKNQV